MNDRQARQACLYFIAVVYLVVGAVFVVIHGTHGDVGRGILSGAASVLGLYGLFNWRAR